MTECCSSGEMAGQEDVAERQKKNNNKKFHRACECNYVERPSAGTTDAEFAGAAADVGQLLLSFSFVTHLKGKKKGP